MFRSVYALGYPGVYFGGTRVYTQAVSGCVLWPYPGIYFGGTRVYTPGYICFEGTGVYTLGVPGYIL